jgi:hypothetical protein
MLIVDPHPPLALVLFYFISLYLIDAVLSVVFFSSFLIFVDDESHHHLDGYG